MEERIAESVCKSENDTIYFYFWTRHRKETFFFSFFFLLDARGLGYRWERSFEVRGRNQRGKRREDKSSKRQKGKQKASRRDSGRKFKVLLLVLSSTNVALPSLECVCCFIRGSKKLRTAGIRRGVVGRERETPLWASYSWKLQAALSRTRSSNTAVKPSLIYGNERVLPHFRIDVLALDSANRESVVSCVVRRVLITFFK